MSVESRHKILFITRSLNIGGAERQLIELAAGLSRAGRAVQVATFYSGGTLEPLLASYGVPHVSLEKRGRWDRWMSPARDSNALARVTLNAMDDLLVGGAALRERIRHDHGMPRLIADTAAHSVLS